MVRIWDVSRRLNIFFFLVKNEKSSHVSQTPYWVTTLFSRPRWFFFQGVPNIWGIPFRTFSGLFGELKTFRGNLGPHVLLITLWRHVKIMLCIHTMFGETSQDVSKPVPCTSTYRHVPVRNMSFFLAWKMKSHLTCLRPHIGSPCFFQGQDSLLFKVFQISEESHLKLFRAYLVSWKRFERF